MAKASSFADKAAKAQKKKDELINVKIVEAYFDDKKKTYRYKNRFIKVKTLDELAKI
ncbi:MAG: hypothetical protein N3F03_07725 [Ignavibacteria bacterium]|nr:hypothetical protein [Ignavibacteria bacterium]